MRRKYLSSQHILMTSLLSFSIFFILLLLEVPTQVSIISSTFLAYQIFSGGTLLMLLLDRSDISWQEFCGIGIALGSLSTLIFDQVFRTTPISNLAWMIPLIWILFACVKFRNFEIHNLKSIRPQITELIISLGIVFLILTPEWFWTLPLAIVLLLTCFQLTKSKLQPFLIFGIVISALVSIFSTYRRPIGWWIEDSDFALYEAISKTLSIWGFRDNINAASTPTNYHWFAYAWAGLIDRLSAAPSWVSNTRIIPLMIIIGIVLTAWSILEKLGFNHKVIVFSLVAIGCFDTIQTWGRGFKIGVIASPSQIYGTLLLLTFLYFFIVSNTNSLKLNIPLFFVLAFSIAGAKVAHGVVLAGATSTVWLFETIRTKSIWIFRNPQGPTILVALFLSFYFVIGGGGGSSRGLLFDQVAFVDGLTGDFRPYGLIIHWIAALVLLFGIFGSQIIGVFGIYLLYSKEQAFLKQFAIGVASTGLFSALLLSGEFAVEIFFTHAASSLLIILIIPIVIHEYFSERSIVSKAHFFIVGAVGLSSAVLANFIPNINSGSIMAITLRTLPSLAGLLPIAGAYLIIRRIKKIKRPTSIMRPYIFLVLSGLTFMAIGFYSANFVKNIVAEYPSFETNYANRTGEDLPDLISASTWIDDNVPTDAIFATNDFCRSISEICNSETDWRTLLEFSMQCSTDQVLRSDDCNAGGYSLLTAIVNRRFLAGNYYVGISDGSAIKPWVVKRVLDSLEFSVNPSADSLQLLKSQGVTWYLLRRELTKNIDWTSFGKTEFSNKSYAIIKLNLDESDT